MPDKDGTDAQGTAKLAKDLRQRSRKLRSSAAWILFVVVLVLLSGIGIFVAAGALANRETTSAVEDNRQAQLTSLRLTRTFTERALQQVRDERAALEIQYRREVEGTGGTGHEGVGPIAVNLRRRLDYLHHREDTLRADLESNDQQISQLSVPATKSIPPEAQISSLVSAISTRIGAIVLLLFLVQILVPLYRYNVRLAAHYESSADAIELLLLSERPVPLELFVRVAAVLSASEVAFGPTPSAPTEQALKLVTGIIAKK
jgi:cell division protein FtsB